MRKLSAKELDQFLEIYLARDVYGRLLHRRCFRGTVKGATQSGYTYLVSLQRPGSTTIEQAMYPAFISSAYVPTAGDDVLCMWTDADAAVVLGPVNGAPPRGLQGMAGGDWGQAGTWSWAVSFPRPFASLGPSIAVSTVVSDSLNGGTVSVTNVTTYGFIYKVSGSAGAGHSYRNWRATGGL